MKNAKPCTKGAFNYIYSNKDNSLKTLTDKLYKYIFIDNNVNINMIKVIEKVMNNNNFEILFNIFESSKNELEKNIKVFN